MIINECSKKYTLSAAVIFACSFLFAEEPVAVFETEDGYEEKIILPDVTTTVEGDSISAGLEALPDFTKIIPLSEQLEYALPRLPGVQVEENGEEPQAEFAESADRQIYAQGLIGAGYPGYFNGDFSIYKSSGANPFLLRFSHLGQEGYGLHKASEGFFERETFLLGNKSFTSENLRADLGIEYNTNTVGLQNKSATVYDITGQIIRTKDSIKWTPGLGFSLGAQGEGCFYKRYGGCIGTDTDVIESSVFLFNPVLLGSWEGYGFNVAMDFGYTLEAYDMILSSSLNRGDLNFSLGWNNDMISIGGNVGVVFGNTISTKVVVPFDLSFGGEWKVGSLKRLLTVTAKGGLLSHLPDFINTEHENRFALSQILFTESSDWFGSLALSIPVFGSMTLDLSGEFRNTAFGNGYCQADYSAMNSNNLYDITQISRMLFDSNVKYSYVWNLMTFAFDWKGHWFYVPVNENQFSVGLMANIQGTTSKWGANLAVLEGFGEGTSDFIPVINAGAFYRLKESLNLELDILDVIKLCSGKDRSYSGSGYIAKSGSVSLSCKFFF